MISAGTVRSWLAGAMVVVAGAGLGACGSSATEITPPACQVLTPSDIQAAVGLQPSTQGGGGTAARSSCVWALPNPQNGAVSTVLVHCGADCSPTLASLAPSPAFSDASGALDSGATARIGSSSVVVEAAGSVLEISVDQVSGDPRNALLTLARRALPRL